MRVRYWNLLSPSAAAGAARKLSFGLLAMLLLGAASAEPIQYTLFVAGGNTSGTLGGVTFTQGLMTLQFTGDTNDVLPYTISNAPDPGTTSGSILLKGTATVAIYDLANNASYSATILPSAGIFVSTDNTHFSVGFGSFGVSPGGAGFPGLPVYPEGMLGNSTGIFGTYDLRSALPWTTGWGISDAGFPGVVAVGPALATTAGDLILNQQGIASSEFEAVLLSYPFASMFATAHANAGANARFAIAGGLTFGAGSNGFNYQTDTTSFQFGPYSATLPAGSLVAGEGGSLNYSGSVAGAQLTIHLYPNHGGTGYRFHISGSNLSLAGLGKVATVGLTLGDNTGSVTIGVHSYGDH